MLQFGYNTGVINAPEVNIENFMKDVYKDRYGEDISEEFIQQLYSVAVSIFAIGGMLGGFSGGWMANRFGRYGYKGKAGPLEQNDAFIAFRSVTQLFHPITGRPMRFYVCVCVRMTALDFILILVTHTHTSW